MKRVKIVGDHPHTGETGELTGKTISPFGSAMYEIKLHNCPHATDACFAKKEFIKENSDGE